MQKKTNRRVLSLVLVLAMVTSFFTILPVISAQGVGYEFEAGEYIAYIDVEKDNVITDISAQPRGSYTKNFSFEYTLITNKGNEIPSAEAADLLNVTMSNQPEGKNFLSGNLTIAGDKISGTVAGDQGTGTLVLALEQKDSTSGVSKNLFVKVYQLTNALGTNRKLYALTFDDGPTAQTDRLLDIFKDTGVSATFFINGTMINDVKYTKGGAEVYPTTAKREYAEGHDIGNHTYGHPWNSSKLKSEILDMNPLADLDNDFYTTNGTNYYPARQTKNYNAYSTAEVAEQVEKQNRVIQDLLGFTPKIFRTPYGVTYNGYPSDSTQKSVFWDSYPMVGMGWDTNDWKNWKAENGGAAEIQRLIGVYAGYGTDGAVLMHDVYAETVDAVEAFLASATAKNIQMVTASEMYEIRGTSLPSDIAVTNVTANESSITIDKGDTYDEITALVSPSNATNAAIMWYSEDPAIASVDADGVITGVAKGRTKVYAVSADNTAITAAIEVTVETAGNDSVTVPAIDIVKEVSYIDSDTVIEAPLTFPTEGIDTISVTFDEAVGNSGTVSWDAENKKIIYTPTGILQKPDVFSYTVTATAQEGYEVTNPPSKSFTVIPSSDIYYDDSFAGETISSGVVSSELAAGKMIWYSGGYTKIPVGRETVTDSARLGKSIFWNGTWGYWGGMTNVSTSNEYAHTVGGSFSGVEEYDKEPTALTPTKLLELMDYIRHDQAIFAVPFTGMGIDLYSRISRDSGIISYSIYNAAGYDITNTSTPKVKSGSISLYDAELDADQLPVVSVQLEEYGEYVLVIRVSDSRTYGARGNLVYVDGVRVYNTLSEEDQKLYTPNATDRQVFTLREAVSNGTTSDAEKTAAIASTQYDPEGSISYKSFATEYLKDSGANEIWLLPGDSVWFYYDGDESDISLELQLSALIGSANYSITGGTGDALNSTTISGMYNFISLSDLVDSSGLTKITVTNSGTGVLTMGKIRIAASATITKQPVGNIIITNPSENEIEHYATGTLVAKNTFDDSDVTAVWIASPENVISIDGNVFTAIGLGEVTLTATSGDKSDSKIITVVPVPVEVAINGSETIKIDDDKTDTSLTAEVSKVGGDTLPSGVSTGVTWSISENDTVSINSETGELTPLKSGTVNVTVTATSVYDTSKSNSISIEITVRKTTPTTVEMAFDVDGAGSKELTVYMTEADGSFEVDIDQYLSYTADGEAVTSDKPVAWTIEEAGKVNVDSPVVISGALSGNLTNNGEVAVVKVRATDDLYETGVYDIITITLLYNVQYTLQSNPAITVKDNAATIALSSGSYTISPKWASDYYPSEVQGLTWRFTKIKGAGDTSFDTNTGVLTVGSEEGAVMITATSTYSCTSLEHYPGTRTLTWVLKLAITDVAKPVHNHSANIGANITYSKGAVIYGGTSIGFVFMKNEATVWNGSQLSSVSSNYTKLVGWKLVTNGDGYSDAGLWSEKTDYTVVGTTVRDPQNTDDFYALIASSTAGTKLNDTGKWVKLLFYPAFTTSATAPTSMNIKFAGLNVIPAEIEAISITAPQEMISWNTQFVTAAISTTPADAVLGYPLTWSVDDPNQLIESIDSLTGYIVFNTANMALITEETTFTISVESANGQTDTRVITVVPPVPDAQVPVITKQPADLTVEKGKSAEVSVTANVTDGGTLSYQWYANTTASTVGATLVEGANKASYSPATTSLITTYYYCVVTNTNSGATNNQTATSISDIAKFVVIGPQSITISYAYVASSSVALTCSGGTGIRGIMVICGTGLYVYNTTNWWSNGQKVTSSFQLMSDYYYFETGGSNNTAYADMPNYALILFRDGNGDLSLYMKDSSNGIQHSTINGKVTTITVGGSLYIGTTPKRDVTFTPTGYAIDSSPSGSPAAPDLSALTLDFAAIASGIYGSSVADSYDSPSIFNDIIEDWKEFDE